jgi:hypothetical protein
MIERPADLATLQHPTMNKTNVAYWIITALFSAFMIFSSYGGITLHPDAVAMLNDKLGYPLYFIQFLSVCKVIGAIAILLPMVPARIKEWAYFGFFLDLVTGMYSFIAVGDPASQWAGMMLFMAILGVAYWLHHIRLKPTI